MFTRTAQHPQGHSTTEMDSLVQDNSSGMLPSSNRRPLPDASTCELTKEAVAAGLHPHESREQHEQLGQVEVYPQAWKLVAILIGLVLAVFLVSLDNTILATAVPKITEQFNSLDHVGWYGSAYLLTNCSVSLLYGKLYTFFSIKWVFLAAFAVFEIGSLVCGTAPNSVALIVGRAVAGLGGSGIVSGATLIITQSVSLQQRALCTGCVTCVYSLAGVVGPLLGGAFTDYLSWRWCFYINLPLGAITFVFIIFFTSAQLPVKPTIGAKQRLSQLDPLGFLLLLPGIICLLLALQWGGATYPWGDGRVIALFAVFGVLMLIFTAVQWWQQDQATIPPRLVTNRNIWGGSLYTFCFGASFLVFTYYLPLWFQSVKDESATKSGILNLPMLIGVAVSTVLSGGIVTLFGQYMPAMYFGILATSVGAGLLTTLHVDSKSSEYLGYQALYGLGVGAGAVQPLMAAQASLSPADVPSGTVIIILMQTMGGAIFVSVAQNMFHNKLIANLASGAPQVNSDAVVAAGATMFRTVVPDEMIPAVLQAYSAAITYCFYVAVALSAAAIFGALPMQWLSLKETKRKDMPPQLAH
ncbi:major facilitator superfamily domain-containing protein [Aspergillus heterothallicus]